MKIKRLRLFQFRAFEDLKIEFPKDANTIVFIGENGAGKTSLIDALSMMLQNAVAEHHTYGAVNWLNEANVHNNYISGKINLVLEDNKRSYELTEEIRKEERRFISEDRVALDKGRDLTDTEKMEIYDNNAKLFFDSKNFEKALEYLFKLETIYKKLDDREILARIFLSIGGCFGLLEKYNEVLDYSKKALEITEVNSLLFQAYYIMEVTYHNLENYQESIIYAEKAISLLDEELERKFFSIYESVSIAYEEIGKTKKAKFYKDKFEAFKQIEDQSTKENITLSNLQNQDKNDIAAFKENIEIWQALLLHYSAKSGSFENYRDASFLAFGIPMTTDFVMISDWFIEYENDENRKRLRVNPNYRNPELAIVRELIQKGLTLLHHDAVFEELQTEINENVKDGQVGTWLSIKKNGLRLNVHQLSDGEKRILVLLIDIARRLISLAKHNKEPLSLEGRGIVLIDEIEQHLHPKWQRRILPCLTEIYPNLQFIVTTHSPLVVSNLFSKSQENDLSAIQKNNFVLRLNNFRAVPIQTIGRDVANVLDEYFGVERRSNLFQKQIDQIFEAFEAENIDLEGIKKQLTVLKNILGDNDPDIKSAEIILNGLEL